MEASVQRREPGAPCGPFYDAPADGGGSGPVTSIEYIAAMSEELALMATAARQPLLAYVLSMALEEARRLTDKP